MKEYRAFYQAWQQDHDLLRFRFYRPAELLQRLESMSEQHPYGRVLRAQQHLFREEREQAVAIFRELAQQWPEDTVLILDYAALRVQDGAVEPRKIGFYTQRGFDIIDRFHNLQNEESRERTEKSFFVPKAEIVENGYDLSINKYKKTEYKSVEYASTTQILAELQELEAEIAKGLAELEGML